MKIRRFLPTVCSLFAVLLASAPLASAADPDFSFFTKLRMEFAGKPGYNPGWRTDDQRHAVIEAYKEKDYVKVLDLSKAWLEKCPVDAEVHFMRGQALIAQGDIAHYSMELYYFYGLVTSITSSGDGTSEKTAFKLISPEEENFVLSDFGAEPTGQTMEGTCDIVRCKVNDGKGGEKEVTYYFDISISIAAEARQFEHNKAGGGAAPARGGN